MTIDGPGAASLPDTGHPDRWKVLFVCCGGLFLLVSSLTSLNVALPDLQLELGASASDLQWIVDSYAVVFGGLLLLGGAVGDRIGRRTALLAGFALVALGGLVGGQAPSVEVVIVARVVTGLGGAVLLPATLSTLTDVFGDRERPQAIAIWSGIAGAGGAFGPAIGGWLIDLRDWTAVFWLNLVLAAAGLVAVVIVVPELPRIARRPFDPLGAALSTLTIGLTLFAVIEAPGDPAGTPVIIAAVAAVAAGVGFVVHEGRTPNPMLPLTVFDSRPRRVGLFTLLLAAVGFAGVVFVAALMLQIGWGESALVTGLLLVPIGGAELAVSFRTTSLCERFGRGNVIGTGLVLMAVGYVGMALVPVGDRLLFVCAGAIAGLGNGLTIPPSVERVVGATEPALAGVVAGANETAIELGASLGVAVLGGVQRVAFAWELPRGAPSESVQAAFEFAEFDSVIDAYLVGNRAALVAAAVIVAAALPIARRHW